MDIDTKSLSNYQCSLLYDAKKGYSSSIQNYLITNNKNTKFEKLLLLNAITGNNIKACTLLLNSNRYNKKLLNTDLDFYDSLFDNEDLEFLKSFFKINFISLNIEEKYIKPFYSWLEEETSLFIKDFFKKKEIKKIMVNF